MQLKWRPSRFFAQQPHWLQKAYCISRTYGIEIFTSVFARKFYEQRWHWSRVEAWNFTESKLLKSNENRLSIFRLNSKLNCSEKSAWKNARFMDDALKTRDIKYLNVGTCLLFGPLSKILAKRLSPSHVHGWINFYRRPQVVDLCFKQLVNIYFFSNIRLVKNTWSISQELAKEHKHMLRCNTLQGRRYTQTSED